MQPTRNAPDNADVVEGEVEAVPHGARRNWIYERIRESVIVGEYPPGMRLNETRLAEALHVSRVPLRESFHTLERDGFIEQQPRRSAIVTEWTLERVDELFDVRIGLEVEATGLATRRRGATGLLREIVEQERIAMAEGRMLEVAEASARFHTAVVAMTGNRLMSTLMSQIAQRMTWLFYLTSARDQDKACDEHRELVDAIDSGNEALARSIAHAHIEKGRVPSWRVLDL